MSKHGVFSFAYGIALAVCGLPFTTWQFWLLMPLAAVWAVKFGGTEGEK